MKAAKAQLKEIPVEYLQRGKYQPRQVFDPEALQELAESIKTQGLIQPLVVREIKSEHYEIIAGERRWRAAQLAGLDQVPCLVKAISDEQAAAVTTIENVQRQDLNPIEEAKAYQRLVDDFDYSHEEVAIVVGKSRTKITNALRLLKLERQVQDWLISGALSNGHGKVLAGLSAQAQLDLGQQTIDKQWSVRKLEQAGHNYAASEEGGQPASQADIKYFERVVSEQLGTEVKLDAAANQRGGWLKIKYFDADTLAGLLEKIKVDAC